MELYPEQEEGNIEYKLKLVKLSEERLEELATQMKYRLIEGGGEAFYEIGVSNDGQLIGLSDEELRTTLENLKLIAEKIGAKYQILREIKGRKGRVLELLIRWVKAEIPVCLSIPVLGNVDSGKSTLISVLCCGELDNGDGLAMKKIARYLHEIQSRRTSSISAHLLGFDENGEVSNYKMLSPLNEADIYLNSSKIVSLIDLGGHERYLRTTLKGILGRYPDYVILTIGANMGVVGTTKEHLGVALALKIPIIVVITKIDMVSSAIRRKVLEDVLTLLKLPGISKVPILISNLNDVVVASKHVNSGRIAPIFEVSNKTGEGLQLLLKFLNLLPPRIMWSERVKKPFKMYVEDKFNVRGVGAVISGVALDGSISVDDIVQVGPFSDGSFRSCRVKSIHVNRVSMQKAIAGQEVTLALTNIKYEEIKKGMVVLDKSLVPRAVRDFEADIFVLHHPTTIRTGYNTVIHVHTVRETAELIQSSKDFLRTGDKARVVFRFKYKPQYIEEGQTFVFREGRTRGIGKILRILN